MRNKIEEILQRVKYPIDGDGLSIEQGTNEIIKLLTDNLPKKRLVAEEWNPDDSERSIGWNTYRSEFLRGLGLDKLPF